MNTCVGSPSVGSFSLSNFWFFNKSLFSTIYPRFSNSAILAVTESAGIGSPVLPESSTFSSGSSTSVPVVVLNTFTTAFCGSATYVISVFVPGSVGTAGGMYPCVGSFGTFGCNGVSPIFGVYPGT